MNQDSPTPSLLVSLVPLLIYTLIFVSIVLWLAPRKGKSRLFALIVLIPLIGPFVMIYLLALPDKKVLDAIADLQNRIIGQ